MTRKPSASWRRRSKWDGTTTWHCLVRYERPSGTHAIANLRTTAPTEAEAIQIARRMLYSDPRRSIRAILAVQAKQSEARA